MSDDEQFVRIATRLELETRIELLNDVKRAADRLRGALEDACEMHRVGDSLIIDALANLREALKICELPNGN
jgi:hypothetical protein